MAVILLFVPLPWPQGKPVEHIFHIQAGENSFTPANIKVQPGDRVTIELTSTDVVHGLSIDGYEEVNLTVDPGQTSRVTFTAGQPGSYRMRCSVACGNLHPFMLGKFQVGPNLLLWRAAGLALLALAAVRVGRSR